MPEEKNKTVNISDVAQNIDQKDNKIRTSGVKTYRDFAVNALRDKPTSLAKMVIEEKKKNEFEYKTSTRNPKNMIIVGLSAFLVVLGVLVIALIVVFVNNNAERVKENSKAINPQSIIYFDFKDEVLLTDISRENIIKIVKDKVANTVIPVGDIKIEYFVKNNNLGDKVLLTSKEFLEFLETRAPVQFIKNLGDRFSYGIYSHADENKPFLVLEFLDVDSIYTNILAWEKMMVSDLGSLFNVNRTFYSKQFADLNLHNKDARVILNSKGEVIFGYSFIDLNHVVFFTDPDQFEKIITFFYNFQKK